MTDTARLKLPLMAAGQSQKHITHNEAIAMIDLLSGIINVTSQTLTAPAGGESDGTVYVLGGTGTGAWSGFSTGDLALMIDGGWRRVLPSTGMLISDANNGGKLYRYNGSIWAFLPTETPEVLTANRTYYVRAAIDGGSDSNDGLTSGTAFLTLGKATSVIAGLLSGPYNVTIDAGAGTFAENVTLPNILGSGTCTLQGAGSGSTTIQKVIVAAKANWTLKSFKLSGGATLLQLNDLATSVLSGASDIDFAGAGTDQVSIGSNATFEATGATYAISGSAPRHWRNDKGGKCNTFGATVNLSGTPAYSFAFNYQGNNAHHVAGSMTFTGSATGKRYSAVAKSHIQNNGGAADYFPGDVPGTVDSSSSIT